MRSARCIPSRPGKGAVLAAAAMIMPAIAVAAQLRSAATRLPVAGAIVVLAEERQPGPYFVIKADSNGAFEVPEGRSGSLLFFHPSYVPREVRTGELTEQVLLAPGTPVAAARGSTAVNESIRIYLVDWIGRFDVERLPVLPPGSPLDCGSSRTVVDVSRPQQTRAVQRNFLRAPAPARMPAIDVNVRVTRAPNRAASGLVYLAPLCPDVRRCTDLVARSRILLPDGTAQFDGVAPDETYVLIAAADGASPVAVRKRFRPGDNILEIASLAPPMRVTARLRCTLAPKGIAVSAELALADAEFVNFRRPATIDADGGIEVDDLGTGRLRLIVSADGRRDAVRDVLMSDLRPRVHIGTLCPAPPFRITGWIVNENGRPLQSSVVQYGDARVESDHNGRFAMLVTKPPEGGLSVVREGYLRWQTWLAPSEDPVPLKIVLTRGVTYRLTVLDGATREPIRDFDVALYHSGSGPRLVFEKSIRSARGRFVTPPLPSDVEEVVIKAAGYETRRVLLRPSDLAKGIDGRDLGTIELSAALRITGRIADEDDRPLPGAAVEARLSTLEEWQTGTAGYSTFTATAGTNGMFELPVPKGTYVLAAREEGYATAEKRDVEVSDPVDIGTLRLERGCSVDVRVRSSAGRPVSSVAVELHRGSAESKIDVKTALTAADGLARFLNVSPDEYSLVIRKSRKLTEMPLHVGSDGCSSDIVDIPVGSTTVYGVATEASNVVPNLTLTLMPSSSSASPRVTIVRQRVGAEGQMITDEILGRGSDAIITMTDATGFFTFDDVAAGRYELIANWSGRSRRRVVTIPDVDRYDASTDFGASVLRGRVFDSLSGQPLAASDVRVENFAGIVLDTAVADSVGNFEIPAPEGEMARLLVSHEGYETRTVELNPNRVRTDALEVGLTIGKLSRRGVVSHAGKPVAGASVAWSASGTSERAAGATTTDGEGRFEIAELPKGVLSLAVGANGLGTEIARFEISEDSAAELHVELRRPAALRLLLPDSVTADQVRFLRAGVDATQLLWRLDAALPRRVGATTWVWTSLAPGEYQLGVGLVFRTVTLTEGSETQVSFRD